MKQGYALRAFRLYFRKGSARSNRLEKNKTNPNRVGLIFFEKMGANYHILRQNWRNCNVQDWYASQAGSRITFGSTSHLYFLSLFEIDSSNSLILFFVEKHKTNPNRIGLVVTAFSFKYETASPSDIAVY